jgi:hypothetical protein
MPIKFACIASLQAALAAPIEFRVLVAHGALLPGAAYIRGVGMQDVVCEKPWWFADPMRREAAFALAA